MLLALALVIIGCGTKQALGFDEETTRGAKLICTLHSYCTSLKEAILGVNWGIEEKIIQVEATGNKGRSKEADD